MLIPQVSPRALSNMSRSQRFANAIGKIIPSGLSSKFEMDQMGTIPRKPLLAIALIFVLGARYFKSRDAHEKREVLTRDGVTVGTAMVGVPILKNWVQRGIDKITKIPVAVERKKLFCLDDFGFDNVKNWYSKAKFNKYGALDVAKQIEERGGDIAKAFSKLGDEGVGYIKTMLNGQEYNSQCILNALKKAYKSGTKGTRNAFNSLTALLSKPDNGLVKAAQIYKAIPNTLSLVTITALLGYGIPAFNIYFTRKKLKGGTHDDKQNHSVLEPQLTNPQKDVISSFLKTK